MMWEGGGDWVEMGEAHEEDKRKRKEKKKTKEDMEKMGRLEVRR